MKKLIRLLSVLLALAMALSVVACGGNTDPSEEETKPTAESKGSAESSEAGESQTETEAKDDTSARYGGHANIRVTKCVGAYPDPLKNQSTWKYMFTCLVYENPLTLDADGNIAPAVCDFELSDDALTLKLWVREGKKFTNGDTVDIYDVDASIKRSFALYSDAQKYTLAYIDMENGGYVLDEAAQTITIKFTEYHERELEFIANYKPFMAVMPKEIAEKYMGPEEYIVSIDDIVGTGGYVYTEWLENDHCTVARAENWEVFESEGTGFASTRYNYLDSLTFWVCSDDGSAALALLSGDYDCVECIPSDYMDMAKTAGIKESVYPSNVGTCFYFAVDAAAQLNVCSRYPSLRKAVMAAIDYEEVMKVITDNQQVLSGQPWTMSSLATDAFVTADYWGACDQAVVDKYLAQAKAEGWDGVEPVIYSGATSGIDNATLFKDAMTKAGIPVEIKLLDSGALTEYRKNIPENTNKWDVTFAWPTWSSTPYTEPTQMYTWWSNDTTKNDLKAKMDVTPINSAEYKTLADEYAAYLVDSCGVGFTGYIGWYWYTPNEFIIEDEGMTRYFFNSYWSDPENHPAK